MSGPSVQVNLWTGIGELAGRRFRVASGSDEGFGRYVGNDGTTIGEVAGTVRVERVAADSSISGTIDVRIVDGPPFTRSFVAPWVPTSMRCG